MYLFGRKKKMNPNYVNLNCLVLGEPSKNRISVKISQYENVGELKRLIKALFAIFGASDLRLWLTNTPIGDDDNVIPSFTPFASGEIFSNNLVKFVWKK